MHEPELLGCYCPEVYAKGRLVPEDEPETPLSPDLKSPSLKVPVTPAEGGAHPGRGLTEGRNKRGAVAVAVSDEPQETPLPLSYWRSSTPNRGRSTEPADAKAPPYERSLWERTARCGAPGPRA